MDAEQRTRLEKELKDTQARLKRVTATRDFRKSQYDSAQLAVNKAAYRIYQLNELLNKENTDGA